TCALPIWRRRDLAPAGRVRLEDQREVLRARLEVEDPARRRARPVDLEVLGPAVAGTASGEAAVEDEQPLLVLVGRRLVDRRDVVHGDLEDAAVLLEVLLHALRFLCVGTRFPERLRRNRSALLGEELRAALADERMVVGRVVRHDVTL